VSIRLSRLSRWIFLHCCAVVLVVFVLFPYYWLVISSFKPLPELTRGTPTLFPESFTLQHYLRILRESEFGRYLFNSTIVAGMTSVVSTIMAVGAGYATTRLRFPERGFITRLLLVGYMFPQVLVLVPLYTMMARLGLTNSLLGLTIVYIGLVAPFGAWLLRGFFASVPRDLEDAALVDGASRVEALRWIFLPLVVPGIISTILYTFIMSWSEYMFALVFITSDINKTVPLGLEAWMTQYTVEWGSLTAAAVLASLPALLFFVVTSRFSRVFLYEGAIKG